MMSVYIILVWKVERMKCCFVLILDLYYQFSLSPSLSYLLTLNPVKSNLHFIMVNVCSPKCYLASSSNHTISREPNRQHIITVSSWNDTLIDRLSKRPYPHESYRAWLGRCCPWWTEVVLRAWFLCWNHAPRVTIISRGHESCGKSQTLRFTVVSSVARTTLSALGRPEGLVHSPGARPTHTTIRSTPRRAFQLLSSMNTSKGWRGIEIREYICFNYGTR